MAYEKPFEQKDGAGALFKNDKEGGNPDWPDYRGTIRVNGQDYWLDAWLKTAKSGKKYMSLSAKPKLAKDTKGAVTHKEPEKFEDDSNIPF